MQLQLVISTGGMSIVINSHLHMFCYPSGSFMHARFYAFLGIKF